MKLYYKYTAKKLYKTDMFVYYICNKMGPVISRPIVFFFFFSEKPQLVTKTKVNTSAFGKFNELNLCLRVAFSQGNNADVIIFDYLFYV